LLPTHNLVAETSAVSNVGVIAQFTIKVLEDDAKLVGHHLLDVKEIVCAAEQIRGETGCDEGNRPQGGSH
jgi:riboflavin synthase